MEPTRSAQITALEQQIKKLKEQDKQERIARLEATPKIMRYSIAVADDKWDKILDPECITYRVTGEVANRVEALAAGHNLDRDSGGMNYLFNKATGRFVMAMGGGTIYVGTFGSDIPTVETTRVMGQLAEFVLKHPEGGDITDIVVEHRRLRDLERQEQQRNRR